MPIHLDKINVKKLGPLASLNHSFGLLNLIYGQNETGKTYLVEFLLGAIFRHSSNWKLREYPGSGAVTISGLQEKSIKFTLKSRQKIEDYWEVKELGLPLNMAQLLMVKGGELQLTETPGGINRDLIRTTLTNEAVLDQIQKSIPKTIQEADLIHQEIQGPNRGVLKNHLQLASQIKKLSNLLERVEDEYSRGPLRQLELKISSIQSSLSVQDQAKKHLAYQLHQQHRKKINQKEKLSDQSIQDIQVQILEFNTKKINLSEQEKKLQENRDASQHYLWLNQAITIWEKRNLGDTKYPDFWIFAIIFLFFLIGLILLGINDLVPGFNFDLIGFPLSLISVGLLVHFGIRSQQSTSTIDDSEERQSIRAEYKTRFGNSLPGLSILKEKREKIQKNYFQLEPLENEVTALKTYLTQSKSNIQNLFEQLSGIHILSKDWENAYQDIKKSSMALTEEVKSLSQELDKLNIPTDLISEQPAAEEYSSQKVIELKKDLNSTELKLDSINDSMNTLKQLICHETGDEISIQWEDLLFNLRSLTNDKELEYRTFTAQLIAMIGVNKILDQIEKEEDQKIQQEINTPEVSALIHSITGSYQTLELIDDQVYVSDPYAQYKLSDLSTGAREQILLALRLGMALNLTGGDPLFLILDDAFQHSDWNRREILVKLMIDLTKKGWQITYLTMDDHLRDLFLKYGKTELKENFTFIGLA